MDLTWRAPQIHGDVVVPVFGTLCNMYYRIWCFVFQSYYSLTLSSILKNFSFAFFKQENYFWSKENLNDRYE